MKLLTLNTHSLIEPAYEVKRDAFVEFIRKEQPDVFALQEVNQTAAAPLLGEIPAGYYPCPVSYTHLDVYKRQDALRGGVHRGPWHCQPGRGQAGGHRQRSLYFLSLIHI